MPIVSIGSGLYDSLYDSADKAEFRACTATATSKADSCERTRESLRNGSVFFEKLGYTLPPELARPKAKGEAKPAPVTIRIELTKIVGLIRDQLKKHSPKVVGARIQPDPKLRRFTD